MKEQIDVIDEKTGRPTGEMASRDDAHTKGLWHRAVHIWFINSKKEILLQRRSKEVKNFPDSWDISSGGHVSSGEEAETAALREIKEELGADIHKDELKMIGDIKQQMVINNGNYIDNEFNNVYLVEKDLDLRKLKKQIEEVQDLKWVPIEKFRKMVKENDKDLVPHPKEYAILLEKICKK